MAEPIFDSATEEIWNELPEHYHRIDKTQDWTLKKLLRSIGMQLNDVQVLVDRLTYDSPEDNEENPHSTSDLVDPAVANLEWLPWLAQLYGYRLVARPRRARGAIAKGFRGGTKAAMLEAARSALVGSKTASLETHRTAIGAGGEWDMLLTTEASETLDNMLTQSVATVSNPSDWTGAYTGDRFSLATTGAADVITNWSQGTPSPGSGGTSGVKNANPSPVGDSYFYLEVTTPNGNDGQIRYNATGTDASLTKFKEGDEVSGSIWVRAGKAANVTFSLYWADASNAILATKSVTVAVPANTWTYIANDNNTFAPAGATRMWAQVSKPFLSGSADYLNANGLMLNYGEKARQFGPVSISGTTDKQYTPFPDSDPEELWEMRALTFSIPDDAVDQDAYTITLTGETRFAAASTTDIYRYMIDVWVPTLDDDETVTGKAVFEQYTVSTGTTFTSVAVNDVRLTNKKQTLIFELQGNNSVPRTFRVKITVGNITPDDLVAVAHAALRIGPSNLWINTTANPAQRVIDLGMKPAGVILHPTTYAISWDVIEADIPTWNDWEARTWIEIEESK